jgi:hypothetical protein
MRKCRRPQQRGKQGNAKFDRGAPFLPKSFSLLTVPPNARGSCGSLRSVDCRSAPLTEKEPNVRGALADDDGVGVLKAASVDGDGKIAGRKPGKRAMEAPRKLIGRRVRSDRLTDGEPEQVANANRRGKREGARAADSDGVEIERNLHADHQPVIFCRIEELPAAGDK